MQVDSPSFTPGGRRYINKRARCQSRFQYNEVRVVQCSRLAVHPLTKHGNEKPGMECTWTDEQEIKS